MVLKPALDIPYCHHEKWDGSGYPRNLRSEEIPFAARIFSVVDVWDALTSERPYREPMEIDEVRQHIASEMQANGVSLKLGVNAESLEKVSGQIKVRATDEQDYLVDQVLFATGRKPNTDGMGLIKAGVTLGKAGEVVVDDYSQTSVSSVYAIGDVTNGIHK